jgi:hypothetical protein
VGKVNPDAKEFGTFANGYQPKGISGHGTLKKTGKTISLRVKTLKGEIKTSNQNIWEAEDGTRWIWDGQTNKYVQLK